MLLAARELQIPLLAALLLGGCACKAWRVILERSVRAGLGPTALFPLRLHRPIMVAMCVSEFSLAIGLLVTFGNVGVGRPNAIRTGTALLFLVAVGALYELRLRRPEAGCGCFGEISDTPVGLRTMTRAGLLCVSAVVTIGLPPVRMPTSPTTAALWLAMLGFELSIIALLSPELAAVFVRLGYSEPCELRRLPVSRSIASLRASSHWRRYAGQISVAASEPTDLWREGCWRFVVYPGTARGRRVDVVFAIYLQVRRPPIRSAMLDADTNEILRRVEARESAVL